jgi:adenylate cyclase
VFYSPTVARKTQEEKWRAVLMGEARGHICWAPWMRAFSRKIPSDPRCKLCDTPFGPPGNIMRFIGFGPSRLNRRICSGCIHALEKRPGGAEVELSFMFADVRGSTGLAQRMPAAEFSQLMARFYVAAAEVVDRRNGIVDKFVGDQAMALFIPGFAGPDHATDAIDAATSSSRRQATATESPGSRSERRCTQGSRSSARSERATPSTSLRSATP